MNLKVSEQSASGLNTDYHTVNMSNGTVYIRSNPDKNENNNIERRR